jgi:hypothetical protein
MNRTIKNRLLITISVILPLCFAPSCKHHPDEIIPPISECDTTNVTYTGEVLPVLQAYCYGCHTGSNPSAGIDLSNPEHLRAVVNNGRLVGSLLHNADYSPMPQGVTLPVCALRQIILWAQDTIFPAGDCDSVNVTFTGTIRPILLLNCQGCHNSTKQAGGLDLSDYLTVAMIAGNGQLMGSVEHSDGYSPMPKNGKQLSDCDLGKLRKWISDTTFVTPPGGIPCDPDTVYFEMDLLPVFLSACAKSGCHDGTNEEAPSLNDYNSIMSAGVKPGNPGGSKIYEVLVTSDPEDRMPYPQGSPPLPSDQIAMIYKWIQQGAKNLHCDNQPCDSTNVTFSGTVWPIIQNNCYGCHSGNNPGGGILLKDYATVAAVAQSGKLYGTIAYLPGYLHMPKNGNQLSQCNIRQVKKWIDLGMPAK